MASRHGCEHQVDQGAILADHRDRDERPGRHVGDPRRRREPDRDLTASRGRGRAGPGDPVLDPPEQAAKLARGQRGVGGKDRDQRPSPGRPAGASILCELDADGPAGDRQFGKPAEVRQYEKTDRHADPAGLDDPGGGADATLQLECRHPPAGTDRSLLDGPRGGRGERVRHVLPADMTTAEVVQERVVALADDRVDGAGCRPDLRTLREQVIEQSLGRSSNGQRVRQRDRRLELAELRDLEQPDRLAEPVDHVARRDHLLAKQVPTMRADDRNPGLHRRVRRIDHRPMPDPNARHVRDRVQRPGRERRDPRSGRGGRQRSVHLADRQG